MKINIYLQAAQLAFVSYDDCDCSCCDSDDCC